MISNVEKEYSTIQIAEIIVVNIILDFQNNINKIGVIPRIQQGSMRRAYCTNCKLEVEIRSSNYVRLANHRVAVEGSCPVCNSVLFNTRVMPTSSRKPMSRKKKRKKLSIYSQSN